MIVYVYPTIYNNIYFNNNKYLLSNTISNSRTRIYHNHTYNNTKTSFYNMVSGMYYIPILNPLSLDLTHGYDR